PPLSPCLQARGSSGCLTRLASGVEPQPDLGSQESRHCGSEGAATPRPVIRRRRYLPPSRPTTLRGVPGFDRPSSVSTFCHGPSSRAHRRSRRGVEYLRPEIHGGQFASIFPVDPILNSNNDLFSRISHLNVLTHGAGPADLLESISNNKLSRPGS